jgi:ABC-type sulfate transport system permease subunit
MIVQGLKLLGAGVVFAGVETVMDKMTKQGPEQAVTIKVTSQASERNDYGGYMVIVLLALVGVVILIVLIMLLVILRDRKARTNNQPDEIPLGRM